MLPELLAKFRATIIPSNPELDKPKENDGTIAPTPRTRPSMSQSTPLSTEPPLKSPATRSPHTRRTSFRYEPSHTSGVPPSPTLPSKRRFEGVQESAFKKRFRPTSITEELKQVCRAHTDPPDAVQAPDPQQYLRQREEAAMKSKPGSDRSLKPINTLALEPGSRNHSRRTAATYGTKGQGSYASGTQAFSSLMVEDQSGTNPVRSQQQFERVVSPSKRRKMDHPIQREVIPLDDDEDVREISKSTFSSRGASPAMVPTSPSHTSNGSLKRPVSAENMFSRAHFTDANNMMNPSYYRKAKTHRPVQSSAGNPISQNQHVPRSLSPQDNDLDFTPKHQQADYLAPVEIPGPAELSEDELQADDETVRSRHFSYAANGVSRVNPSTSSSNSVALTSKPKSSMRQGNLRDQFVRRQSGDEDELSKGYIPTQSTKQKPRKKSDTKSVSWPLAYFKNYTVEERGHQLHMALKEDSAIPAFEIWQKKGNNTVLKYEFSLHKLTLVNTDRLNRIRLRGSANTAGNSFYNDIEFCNADDINAFIDKYIGADSSIKFYYRSKDYMVNIFSKPLVENKKTHAPVVDEEFNLLDARGQHRQKEGVSSRPSLIRQLKSVPIQPQRSVRSKLLPSAIEDNLLSLAGPPARATRSSTTRPNSSPKYIELPDESPVTKYSVRVGLGAKWPKPVQYGEGRRRALVEFEDMEKLDEDEMLNDALVDFYLIYLYNQVNVPEKTVYFFNTHFFTALTRTAPGQKGDINYAKVSKWVKEDIFAYDYIVVPVCEDMHWYLVIMCNVSELGRKYILEDLGSGSPLPEATDVEARIDPITKSDDHGVPKVHTGQQKLLGSDASDANLFDIEQATNIELQPITEVLPCAASVSIENPEQMDNEQRESSLEETSQFRKLSINSPTSDQKPAMEADEPEQGPISVNAVDNQETDNFSVNAPESSVEPTSTTSAVGQAHSMLVAGKKKMKRRPAALKQLPLNEPIILVLDSMGATHPRACRALKQYITQEALNKRNMAAEITQKPFYVKETHIPLQNNFVDCGVYLLAYWKKFISNPRQFVTSLLMREMDPETDWPNMTAGGIRSDVRDTLARLAAEQGKTHKELKRARKANKIPGQSDQEKNVLVESRPEPQPEPKIEQQSEPTLEPQHEPQAQPQTKVQSEMTSEPQPDPSFKLGSPIQLQPSKPRPSTPEPSSQTAVGDDAKSSERSSTRRSPQVVIRKIALKFKQSPGEDERPRSKGREVKDCMSVAKHAEATVGEQSEIINEPSVIPPSPTNTRRSRSSQHRKQPSVSKIIRSPGKTTVGKASPARHPGSSHSPIPINDSQDSIEDVPDTGPLLSNGKGPNSPAKERHVTDGLFKEPYRSPRGIMNGKIWRRGEIDEIVDEDSREEIPETPEPPDRQESASGEHEVIEL